MTMAKLGGRNARTLLTSLEVLSGDGKDVLAFNRSEDGSVVIRTRKVYEDYWTNNGLRFEVRQADARMLGSLMRGEDQSWNRTAIDEIDGSAFSGPEPEDVVEARLREKMVECSELDLERAKAENLKEQRRNIELEMERDHALDKHNPRIDGCPACERAIRPGYGDGSQRMIDLADATPEQIAESQRWPSEALQEDAERDRDWKSGEEMAF